MKNILIALVLIQGVAHAQTPCPRWGLAREGTLVYALNMKKNRMDVPKNYRQISVTDFLAFPDDSLGDGKAFELVGGYVVDVKKQGQESCNCKSKIARDFHIVVVPHPEDRGDKSKYVIVEITPGFKEKYSWNDSVILALKNNYVDFSGIKFADLEHKNMSVKSNPTRKTCWRGTINELHPVTRFVKKANGH
ncbi:MAG: hypothetical protein NT040_01365 [Bacteroidetes bacterium]|nr:hypothetical protein [Bacteroidota bacterium]